jgi:hypothetical protein
MGVFFRKKSEEEIKQEQPETNAEKKAKRLEELKKEIQGKAKGGQAKVAKVMREFKKGKLHSGDKKGPVVKNPKQAIAIALSEAGMSKPQKKKDGGMVRFKKQYQMHNGKF